MSEHKIIVESGTTMRLLTGGKYCDRDILVEALGESIATVEAINYSEWDSGKFTETLDNGSMLEYAVELEDGKPVRITGPDGTKTLVDWGNG